MVEFIDEACRYCHVAVYNFRTLCEDCEVMKEYKSREEKEGAIS